LIVSKTRNVEEKRSQSHNIPFLPHIVVYPAGVFNY
jgi:hypothetical protein